MSSCYPCCCCKKPKPSGFKKDSTASYMNSIIQAIASSDLIIKQFRDVENKNNKSQSLKIFLQLLDGINKEDKNNKNLSSNTQQLKSLVDKLAITNPENPDASDLFTVFINRIHEDIKDHSTEPIEVPMQIKLIHQFTSADKSDEIINQVVLSLGLCGPYESKPGVTLDHLIQVHLSATSKDGDESKKTQMFFYKDAPSILLLHIQATKFDPKTKEMIKLGYHINYDETLLLNLDIIPERNSEIRRVRSNYKIKAIIKCSKKDVKCYVTYRKWQDKWFKFKDEKITEVKFNKSIKPYILVLEKENVTETEA